MSRYYQGSRSYLTLSFPFSSNQCNELPFQLSRLMKDSNLSSLKIIESYYMCSCNECWKHLFKSLNEQTSIKKLWLSLRTINKIMKAGLIAGLKNMTSLTKVTVELLYNLNTVDKLHSYVECLQQLCNSAGSFSLKISQQAERRADDEDLAKIIQGLQNPTSLSLRLEYIDDRKSSQNQKKNLLLKEIANLIKRTNIRSLKLKNFPSDYFLSCPNLLSLGEALKESRSLTILYLQLTNILKNNRRQLQTLMREISSNQSIQVLNLSDSPDFNEQTHVIFYVPQKLQILEVKDIWVDFENLPESLQTLKLNIQNYDNSKNYYQTKMMNSLKSLEINVLKESPFPSFIQRVFPSVEKLTITIKQLCDTKLLEYFNQNRNLQKVELKLLQLSNQNDLLQLCQTLDAYQNITSLQLIIAQIKLPLKIGPLPQHLNEFTLKVNLISDEQVCQVIESFASQLSKNSSLISFHLQLRSNLMAISLQNLDISKFRQLFNNPCITNFDLELNDLMPKGLSLFQKLANWRLSVVHQAIVFKKQIEVFIPINPKYCFSDLYLQ